MFSKTFIKFRTIILSHPFLLFTIPKTWAFAFKMWFFFEMCFHFQNVKGFLSFFPFSEKYNCKQKSVQLLQIALLMIYIKLLNLFQLSRIYNLLYLFLCLSWCVFLNVPNDIRIPLSKLLACWIPLELFLCINTFIFFSDKKSLCPQGLQIKQSDHLKKKYYDMWANL